MTQTLNSDLLENITIHFSEDELNEISQWFDEKSVTKEIGEENVNVITIEDFVEFLDLKKYHIRNFRYPSYMEIMKEAERLQAGVSRVLTKDQVILMTNKWFLLPNIKHEMKLAFKVFDTEKRNVLDVDEIEVIVTQYGDVFNDAELKELLRDANNTGDGNVVYNDFVESLFNVAPELLDLKVEYLYENPDEDPSIQERSESKAKLLQESSIQERSESKAKLLQESS